MFDSMIYIQGFTIHIMGRGMQWFKGKPAKKQLYVLFD